MNFKQILLFPLLALPLFVHAQQTADNGVFSYTIWNKHSISHTMSVLLTDTIFVYNNIGIEKVMQQEDLIINDKFSSTTSLYTYYRIDFAKRHFQDIGKELNYKRDADLPFTSPKLGIDFRYNYYHGEKYTVTDTTINHQPCKVFRFTGNADNPLKDARITLIFTEMNTKGIHIIPNLEDIFNGRLLSFEATDDKDGRIVLVMEHIQPLSNYWKEVISQTLF